jgi:hypothetical protein
MPRDSARGGCVGGAGVTAVPSDGAGLNGPASRLPGQSAARGGTAVWVREHGGDMLLVVSLALLGAGGLGWLAGAHATAEGSPSTTS